MDGSIHARLSFNISLGLLLACNPERVLHNCFLCNFLFSMSSFSGKYMDKVGCTSWQQ